MATTIHTTAILCCYYLTPEEILRKARQLFKRWNEVSFEIYCTNPRHPPPSDTQAGFHRVENEVNDFSAYMQACRDIVDGQHHEARSSAYIFLNDTLFERHPAKLLLRLLERTLPTVRHAPFPVLSGKADEYRALLQTSPFAMGLDHYISTFLFATNSAGVSLLHSLFTSPETAAMMRSAAALEPGNRIPDRFVTFLKLHLHTEHTRFSWPGARTDEDLSRKSVCVLLEHLVSAKFFTEGFIFPMNFNVMLDLALWSGYRLRSLRWR